MLKCITRMPTPSTGDGTLSGSTARGAIPALCEIINSQPGEGPAFAGYKAGSSYQAKWPRIAAATVLWKIDPGNQLTLKTMMQTLEDRDETDNRLANAAVQSLESMGKSAVQALPLLEQLRKQNRSSYSVELVSKAIKTIARAPHQGKQ
jgi:hypothetical protein